MGANQRFTPLQKKEALRIVTEHFGIVNESTLDDIQRAIGRRPTRQGVQRWIEPEGKKNKQIVSSSKSAGTCAKNGNARQ
jgi:hypothetical protein